MGQTDITAWLGIPRPQPPENHDDQGDESDTTTESQSEHTHGLARDRNRDRGGVSERSSGTARGDIGDDSRDEMQNSGDVKNLLLDIRSEMRYMNRKFNNLESSIN